MVNGRVSMHLNAPTVVDYDPSKCFYGALVGCGICAYCRGDVTNIVIRGSKTRKPCGHAVYVRCACVKIRKEPPTWPFPSSYTPIIIVDG